MKNQHYYQGRFQPKNPKKYKGDFQNIIYRSGWELKLFKYLDEHPNVLWWGSEEVIIPYISPKDGERHRYFPDMICCVKDKDGNEKIKLIEVKPSAQTKEPKIPKRKTKRFINEVFTYGVNQAKWEAARKFCEHKGWEFMIITEKELGIK